MILNNFWSEGTKEDAESRKTSEKKVDASI